MQNIFPVLLDRVLLRLGNVDTDEQLESCLGRFLPPVILKLSSPHEQVSILLIDYFCYLFNFYLSILIRYLFCKLILIFFYIHQVRTKVMELLVHVNKRVKCRSEVQLPIKTLLENYKDPKANSFIIVSFTYTNLFQLEYNNQLYFKLNKKIYVKIFRTSP